MIKKKFIKILYSLMLLLLVILTSYSLSKYINQKYKVIKINMDIKEGMSLIENANEDKTLEYYKKYYSNEDIVGTLKIYETDVDTLLVKAPNNEYYLNHSLEKKYSDIGSIYIDYRVNLNSKQINIYGHSSQVYNVMFNELHKYLDEEYYDDHKYIELWDGEQIYIYEIFSVQIVTNDYEHMSVAPSNWENHINKLNMSIYNTGARATEQDDVLVIQTCNYNPANSFLIINAKKSF